MKKTAVALATLAKVPLKIADRLMGGDRPDPILILCKAAGLGWPAVKAVILARPDNSRHFDGRGSTTPLPITAGCRHRPRSAWSASGSGRT